MPFSDFAFANDIRAAAALRTPRTSRMLLWTSLALLACFIVWAHFAVLDEVKRGGGRVVPSQQRQVVQTLEGGIVSNILVKEGAIVEKGQSLVRIDDTKFAAELGEVTARRAAMAARVARLEAEANGHSQVTFPPDLVKQVPSAVASETSVFEMDAAKVAKDIDVLDQQVAGLTDSMKLLDRERDLTRNLYRQKVVPEIEMLRLDQKAADMKGQLAQAQAKITAVTASFRAQADGELAKSRSDLAVLDENIKSARAAVRRTDLRSPVHGIVNKLNVTTIGAVLQPGAEVMDIVPLGDTLLVEAHIRPQDIAFIRPNQDAVVRVTAYDSSVYGTLKGKVKSISADTIVEGANSNHPQTFYRVMVRTEKNHLGTDANPLPIIPGMITTVEIKTGRKSVLDYLIKPARILRQEALREH